MSVVLDTNVVLYWMRGELEELLPDEDVFISVITEIELLCWKFLAPQDEAAMREFVSDLTVLPLNNAVKEESIRLRRLFNLKLPDAIILGSAIVNQFELLTNDNEFRKCPERQCRFVK